MFALAQTCMASPDVYEENTYLNTLHSQNSKEDSPVLYHSNNTANSDGPQKQTPGKYPPSLVGSSQVIKLLGEGQLTLVWKSDFIDFYIHSAKSSFIGVPQCS